MSYAYAEDYDSDLKNIVSSKTVSFYAGAVLNFSGQLKTKMTTKRIAVDALRLLMSLVMILMKVPSWQQKFWNVLPFDLFYHCCHWNYWSKNWIDFASDGFAFD